MNRWSNPFVSTLVLVLLAACSTTSREDDQAPKRYVVRPAADGAVRAQAVIPEKPAAPDSSIGTAAAASSADASTAPPTAQGAEPAAVPAAAPAAAHAAKVTASGNSSPSTISAVPAVPAVPAGPPVPEQVVRQYADALKAMKAGQVTDAELQFKQLAASHPELSGPQLNLGLLYLQAARLPEAEASFEAALEHNPGNAVAGNELGIVLRKLGRFSDAEAAYQRSIAAEPTYAPAYLNLGVLYDLYLAEPKKALEQFEHYTALAGDNKQVAGWVAELRKRVAAPAAVKKDPA